MGGDDYLEHLKLHWKDINDPKNQQMAQSLGGYLQMEMDRDEYLGRFNWDVDPGEGGPQNSWSFSVHATNNRLVTRNREHVEIRMTLLYVYKTERGLLPGPERRFQASLFLYPAEHLDSQIGNLKTRLRGHKIGWGQRATPIRRFNDFVATLKIILRDVEGIQPGFDGGAGTPPTPNPSEPKGSAKPVPVREEAMQMAIAWIRKNCRFCGGMRQCE